MAVRADTAREAVADMAVKEAIRSPSVSWAPSRISQQPKSSSEKQAGEAQQAPQARAQAIQGRRAFPPLPGKPSVLSSSDRFYAVRSLRSWVTASRSPVEQTTRTPS